MESGTLNLSVTPDISEKDVAELDSNLDIKNVKPFLILTKSQV